MTTCAVTFSHLWRSRKGINVTGAPQAAVSTCIGKAFSRQKLSDVTAFHFRQSNTRLPNQSEKGRPNRNGERSLVPLSPTEASVKWKSILDAQLRDTFGRVVYSHKAHEKEAEILLAKLSRIKLGQILLSAVSTGGFVAVLFGTGRWGSLIGGFCAAALLVLNLYTRSYDLGQEAQDHRNAAILVWSIREKYLSLITDLAIGSTPLSEHQHKKGYSGRCSS